MEYHPFLEKGFKSVLMTCPNYDGVRERNTLYSLARKDERAQSSIKATSEHYFLSNVRTVSKAAERKLTRNGNAYGFPEHVDAIKK